jgi:hypothetical protein
LVALLEKKGKLSKDLKLHFFKAMMKYFALCNFKQTGPESFDETAVETVFF